MLCYVCVCVYSLYTSIPQTYDQISQFNPTSHPNSCSADSPVVTVGPHRTQYLTLQSRVLCEKPIVPQLIKLAEFHGTQTLMTVFTISRHRTLSRARLIQSVLSRPLSLTCILNIFVPSTPRSKVVSFLQVSPPKLCIIFLSIRATCPAHPVLLYLMCTANDVDLPYAVLSSILSPPPSYAKISPAPYSRTPSACSRTLLGPLPHARTHTPRSTNL